jgi:non-homologous end joining protein Ku
MSLIARKAKGEAIKPPPEAPAAAEQDLLRALEQSLATKGGRSERARAKTGSAR